MLLSYEYQTWVSLTNYSQVKEDRQQIIKQEAQWKAWRYIFLKQLPMMYLSILFEMDLRSFFVKFDCLYSLKYDSNIFMWPSRLIFDLRALIQHQNMSKPTSRKSHHKNTSFGSCSLTFAQSLKVSGSEEDSNLNAAMSAVAGAPSKFVKQ